MGDDLREGEGAERSLGLRQYRDALWRRKLTLAVVLLACVGAAVALTVAQPKKYRATTRIVVGQGNGLIPSAYSNAVQPYTATMADLVRSNIVAERVKRQLGLAESTQDLLRQVSVSINPSTAVMTVNVVDRSRARAVRIASSMATVFSRLVKSRFGSQPQNLGGGQVQLPLTATVFDPAYASPTAVSPKPKQNVALGLIVGIVLGLLAAFLREHLDRRLRTRRDVEEQFAVPVIAQIPFERLEKGNERPVAWSGTGILAESFRTLRANLQYLGVRRPLRTILVTSAGPEQGKTTVAANVALALARSGAATVVVDGDLRRPRLAETFGIRRPVGVTNVLIDVSSLDDALVELPVEGLAGDEVAPLALLPAGPVPPNPSELLASAHMTALLERLSLLYEHVIVDSPPLLAVADGLELARMVDGVVVVARRNRATVDEAREIRSTASRLSLNLVGTVFTDADAPPSYHGDYGDAPQEPTSRPRVAAFGDDLT